MRHAARAARGFSLVEVMVALVIGLFVVGAVLMNYLGTGAAGTQRSQVSQMAEDAQVALVQITRDLQMAGYTDVANVVSSGPGGTASFVRPGGSFRPVFACEGQFVNPHTAALWAVTCLPAATAGQSLEVNYQATSANVMLTSAGIPTDCVGNRLDVAKTQRDEPVLGTLMFTSNRYYINRSTGRPELHCASPAAGSSGGQPLVDNVEDLRFWFGVAPDWNAAEHDQRQPVRFLAPSGMAAGDWGRTVSVRICLLMRTAEPVMSAEETVAFRYRNCAGVDGQTSPDRRIYRAFHATVSLRNRSGF